MKPAKNDGDENSDHRNLGFVGSTLAKAIAASGIATEIIGIDNFSRAGSELNRRPLIKLGIRVIHGDIRVASDVESLPPADWVIDAAANPSVLAGVDGKTSSRQLIEHNLAGTINLLEYCKRYSAGFNLLSTSRVYSIPASPIWRWTRSMKLSLRRVTRASPRASLPQS